VRPSAGALQHRCSTAALLASPDAMPLLTEVHPGHGLAQHVLNDLHLAPCASQLSTQGVHMCQLNPRFAARDARFSASMACFPPLNPRSEQPDQWPPVSCLSPLDPRRPADSRLAALAATPAPPNLGFTAPFVPLYSSDPRLTSSDLTVLPHVAAPAASELSHLGSPPQAARISPCDPRLAQPMPASPPPPCSVLMGNTNGMPAHSRIQVPPTDGTPGQPSLAAAVATLPTTTALHESNAVANVRVTNGSEHAPKQRRGLMEALFHRGHLS
jgi:hypothetical protein